MKKILFVNDEMTMGGVARILNTLLSNLDPHEYEMDLLVLHPHGELMKEIPSYINIIPSSSFFSVVDIPISQIVKKFNVMQFIRKLYLVFLMKTGLIDRKIRKERKKIIKKDYDIEFSAKEGFCTIFTAYGESKKKYNWVQVDYEEHNYARNHMGVMKEALKYIDLNLACSIKVCEAFKNVFEVKNVEVLHNLMDEEKIEKSLKEEVEYPFNSGIKFISVARFHPQKSIDRLINAVKYAKDKECDINLVLIGGGELEEEIVNQISSLNLNDCVTLLGYKNNPYSYIAEADCFVLSSLYEGYPTIVLESLMSHTPVLACNVAGVSEQILNPEDGWIIENTQEALNSKIVELCNSPKTLQKCKTDLMNYKTENAIIKQRIEEYFNE